LGCHVDGSCCGTVYPPTLASTLRSIVGQLLHNALQIPQGIPTVDDRSTVATFLISASQMQSCGYGFSIDVMNAYQLPIPGLYLVISYGI
jgi:hypothetical protein